MGRLGDQQASQFYELASRHRRVADEAFQAWALSREQEQHATAMLHAQMATMYAGMAAAAKTVLNH